MRLDAVLSALQVMRFHRIIAILIAISMVAPAGCSFLLVEGPPKPDEIPFRRMDDSFCTERNGAPVVDSVAAGVIPFIGLMSVYNLGGRDIGETEAMLTSALVLTGVEAASAIWGFHTTRRCRQYTARQLRTERPAQAP
jgi:hypothetical protein